MLWLHGMSLYSPPTPHPLPSSFQSEVWEGRGGVCTDPHGLPGPEPLQIVLFLGVPNDGLLLLPSTLVFVLDECVSGHRHLFPSRRQKRKLVAVSLESHLVLFGHKCLLAPDKRKARTDSPAATGTAQVPTEGDGPVPGMMIETPPPPKAGLLNLL